MSREEYQIPTGGGFGSGIGGGSSNTFETGLGAVMHYRCGDCAVRVALAEGAPIRCQKCGARVLYKERTKRMVQFEAR